MREQIALIERAITERPDAVVFVPVHETAVNDAILGFDAARIPLFNFITRTTVGQGVCFVGSDDHALAMSIARHLFSKLSGRGRSSSSKGRLHLRPAASGSTGFVRRLRTIRYRGPMSLRGDYQRDVARAAFADTIDQLPNVDAVLCANDHMALGVLDVLGRSRVIARCWWSG